MCFTCNTELLGQMHQLRWTEIKHETCMYVLSPGFPLYTPVQSSPPPSVNLLLVVTASSHNPVQCNLPSS